MTKVGTATVSGATNIDCGFSSGSRLVIIKRYDASGDWMLFNTTTGLVAGNDALITLNNNTAISSNTDPIDPLNAGFTLNGSVVGNGDYVFLAVAA